MSLFKNFSQHSIVYVTYLGVYSEPVRRREEREEREENKGQ